jgi:NADPH-dependent curcumin reductase CurA
MQPSMPLQGKRVLVHAGAGGVGSFAIQVCRQRMSNSAAAAAVVPGEVWIYVLKVESSSCTMLAAYGIIRRVLKLQAVAPRTMQLACAHFPVQLTQCCVLVAAALAYLACPNFVPPCR